MSLKSFLQLLLYLLEDFKGEKNLRQHFFHMYNILVSSITQSCLTLCSPMDCSTPGSSVFHYLLEFAQTHVHWVDDAIQPSHPLHLFSSCPQSFWASGCLVSCSHQVVKVLEHQLQHQSFKRIFSVISFRIDWFDLHVVQGTLKSLL